MSKYNKKVEKNGDKSWHSNGTYYKGDGQPAVENADSSKEWYHNGTSMMNFIKKMDIEKEKMTK